MADTDMILPDPDDTVIDVMEPGLRGPDDAVDDAVVAHAAALAAVGAGLWSLSLVNAPMAHRVYEWLTRPRLGDLVLVEQARSQHAVHRVGELVCAWTFVGPSWDPGDRFREEVWMLATLDGRGITWTNCRLLRLPRDEDEYIEMLNYS